jgi:hypothetical protein
MQLSIAFHEVIALATASDPIPPIVRSLSAEGEVVRAEFDPSRSSPVRSHALSLQPPERSRSLLASTDSRRASQASR